MEPQVVSYVASEYIRTTTSNMVSRMAVVHGPQNVNLRGKSIVMPNAILRGELAAIRIGRYCLIGEGTVIRPACRLERRDDDGSGGGGMAGAADGGDEMSGSGEAAGDAALKHAAGAGGFVCLFTPVTVGNYTHVGRNSVVEAACIGCNVWIGDDCIIGANCLIRDNCRVESGAVLPAGTVVPPFSVVRGCPAHVEEDLPESAAATQREAAVAFFEHFRPAGD
ncbi:unnamed protein product [Phaeothamnion confervicola]